MSQEPIELVEYDPEWVDEYDERRREMLDAVGEHLDAVAHVGSTAVPGLAAKPIIDVMALAESPAVLDACVEGLVDLGWEYAPEFEEEVPNRRYFRRTDGERHTHHLHVVDGSAGWWERHVAFRDYLREHPDVAAEYEAVKREAAEAHRWSVDEYTGAKTEFVREIEEQAKQYYAGE